MLEKGGSFGGGSGGRLSMLGTFTGVCLGRAAGGGIELTGGRGGGGVGLTDSGFSFGRGSELDFGGSTGAEDSAGLRVGMLFL